MNARVAAFSRFLLSCLLCLAFFGTSLARAEGSAPPNKVVTIEGITEFRLDNGLRVLLFPDPSSSTVTVNLTILTGSRQEGYGETGMAHLLEHMVFKGTPLHPDVPRALKEHGAQFNGSTWVDRTNYYETMPAEDANLEFGIRLEADRMVNSFIRREDLASEMTVVRSEFEMGENDPRNVLSQRMTAVAYEWHNYGKSTIGNRSDIERVPIENLQAFYRKHYQPDNAALVVAGNFNEGKALGYIAKYFGVLKRPVRKLDETYTEEPAQDGERTVVLRRVGKVGVVGAIYHICAGAHDDFPAMQVLTSVLTSEPSGRLYKALVESKKASRLTGTAENWHDPGVLELLAEVDKSASLDDARNTMIDLLEGLSKETFSEAEVERAKAKLLKDRELRMTRSGSIGIELSEWAAKGDWRLFFLHRDRLEKVTPADVARVARRYLVRSNRTVGLYIPAGKPERAPVPPTPSVAALVKDYKGGKAITAGEAFEPTPANVEKRVQRSQLPEGVKVALLPRKTRGESVVAELTLRFGNEKSLAPYIQAADMLGSLMMRGTKKHDRQQLQDELDRLKVRMFVSSDLGSLTATVEGKRPSLIPALQLLGEVLREPTFPTAEFDILKRQSLAGLERQLTEPRYLAQQALRRRLSPYPKDNIRYVPTMEEEIDQVRILTVEQVHKLYQDQLGAEAGELVVVGDFEPHAVLKQVADIVKDWKASVRYERIARPAVTDVAGAKEVILTPDKENAVYFAGHSIAMTDSDPDYAALELADFLFGGGSLSSRLGNRVRQKEGLSYGVGSHFNASAQDKAGRFMLFAICNPKNMGKVDKAIAEELDKLLKEGVDSKELAEARKSYLAMRRTRWANDQAVASFLSDGLYNGRTMDYYTDLEKKIAALGPEDINTAVRKHLAPKKLIVIQGGDFKKASQ